MSINGQTVSIRNGQSDPATSGSSHMTQIQGSWNFHCAHQAVTKDQCMCWINQITTWENCYTCHAMTAGVWNWHGDATLYGPIHRPHEKVGHRISGVQAAVTKDHPNAGPIKQPILIVGHCFWKCLRWIELNFASYSLKIFNRFSSDTWRLCVREIYIFEDQYKTQKYQTFMLICYHYSGRTWYYMEMKAKNTLYGTGPIFWAPTVARLFVVQT